MLSTDEIMINYLNSIPKDEWLSKDNIDLIYYNIQNPYNNVIDYFAKSKKSQTNTAVVDYYIDTILDHVYLECIRGIVDKYQFFFVYWQ